VKNEVNGQLIFTNTVNRNWRFSPTDTKA